MIKLMLEEYLDEMATIFKSKEYGICEIPVSIPYFAVFVYPKMQF